MIVAALLVMVAMGFLLFDYQRDSRTELARSQGLDLERLLGGMSWNELIPEAGRKSLPEVLQRGQSNADFAYGAVVDVDGKVAAEVTRSGVIIPAARIAAEPANWLRQRTVTGVDTDLFRIAVNNLLTNAIKYNKPGGRVTMSASEDNDSIEIVVSDEGYGISDEDGQQIFNKFYRSTNENIRKQVGHGLSLSLARQIVMMHHGDLDFESEPGKGTRFLIRLEKVSTQILNAAAS